MKQIDSRDNPGYKALKALAADAREQRRQGRALLDGVHLLQAYRDKCGPPLRLIVSEHGMTQPEVRALRESLVDVECWLLRDKLFAALSELASPSGILALIEIPQAADDGSAPQTSCVLLDGIQDVGNVGSILRTAAAAGIRDVFLGSGCAGAWTPRVLRAAQGAHFDLRIRESADLAAVMQRFTGIRIAASAHGAQPLFELDLRAPLAWLFGSEGQGISPALERLADQRAIIPLAAGSESLNVAAAAAICLFEEVRQKRG
ncbi:tRNA/rRNA methyltransferase protein [Sterolibacterium denitrificans]|uniref:tRNA/rRNA methyltransferase protein n=1 Tax=Sterolibacterium denitrificans TaxID=157592 RepID=A0A7Z7MV33_9PROT|nr:RNA methyltransferase [Sterolibacterium denitrificans]SMB25749.1 tRNA/rRNA methyltransferase protein [Sterolibacterium denitrificans]